MPALEGLDRARRPDHLPTVLSRRDVVALRDQRAPPFRLIGEILYGAGLRLNEALSLRVKDIDLERHPIMVRHGNGGPRPPRAPSDARARRAARAARRRRIPSSRGAHRGPGRGRPPLRPPRKDARRRDKPRVAVRLPRRAPASIQRPAASSSGTSTTRRCRRPSARLRSPRRSIAAPPVTRSATPSPRTSSKGVIPIAWAIRISAHRRAGVSTPRGPTVRARSTRCTWPRSGGACSRPPAGGRLAAPTTQLESHPTRAFHSAPAWKPVARAFTCRA